ncbi:MAG: hypothetical protein AVDCRST_MAG54-4714, partial [uncultured Actinomycetospora sp.]
PPPGAGARRGRGARGAADRGAGGAEPADRRRPQRRAALRHRGADAPVRGLEVVGHRPRDGAGRRRPRGRRAAPGAATAAGGGGLLGGGAGGPAAGGRGGAAPGLRAPLPARRPARAGGPHRVRGRGGGRVPPWRDGAVGAARRGHAGRLDHAAAGHAARAGRRRGGPDRRRAPAGRRGVRGRPPVGARARALHTHALPGDGPRPAGPARARRPRRARRLVRAGADHPRRDRSGGRRRAAPARRDAGREALVPARHLDLAGGPALGAV